MSDLKGEPIGGECGELLKKYFINDFRFGYKRYRGVTMPVSFEPYMDKIENLIVREDDIWVMSYPKTGERKYFLNKLKSTSKW